MGKLSGASLNQKDLISWMTAVNTICNELKDDVDQLKLTVAALLAQIDADAGTTGTDFADVLAADGSSTANRLPAALSADDLSLTV